MIRGFNLDILKGISAALKGQRNIKPPKGWDEMAPKLAKSPNAEVRQLAQSLVADVWEQGGAGCVAEGVGGWEGESAGATEGVGGVGGGAGQGSCRRCCGGCCGRKRCGGRRCGGWGRLRIAKTSSAILKIYAKLDTAGKRDALTTLASRVSFAKALMAAVARGVVKANELPADIVRQLRAHGVKDINATLDKVWGVSRSTPAAKLAEIAKYKKLLEAKVNRPVDLPRGRALVPTHLRAVS